MSNERAMMDKGGRSTLVGVSTYSCLNDDYPTEGLRCIYAPLQASVSRIVVRHSQLSPFTSTWGNGMAEPDNCLVGEKKANPDGCLALSCQDSLPPSRASGYSRRYVVALLMRGPDIHQLDEVMPVTCAEPRSPWYREVDTPSSALRKGQVVIARWPWPQPRRLAAGQSP